MSFGFDRTFFAREVFTGIMFGRDRKWQDVPPIIPLALQLTAESGLTYAGPLLPRRDGNGLQVALRRLHPSDLDAY